MDRPWTGEGSDRSHFLLYLVAGEGHPVEPEQASYRPGDGSGDLL